MRRAARAPASTPTTASSTAATAIRCASTRRPAAGESASTPSPTAKTAAAAASDAEQSAPTVTATTRPEDYMSWMIARRNKNGMHTVRTYIHTY